LSKISGNDKIKTMAKTKKRKIVPPSSQRFSGFLSGGISCQKMVV